MIRTDHFNCIGPERDMENYTFKSMEVFSQKKLRTEYV